jgi:zinc transporter ZupT
LIVGFILHNTTEGLAIVAPMAKEKPKIMYILILDIIASAPTIIGARMGGFVIAYRINSVPCNRSRGNISGSSSN